MKLARAMAALVAAGTTAAAGAALADGGGASDSSSRVAQVQTEPPLEPGQINPLPGQESVVPVPDIVPTVQNPPWMPRSGFGIGVTAGGGVGNYTQSDIRATTGVQGIWDVRASFGTRTYVGVEAAYVGAAGSVSGLGLTTGNTLVRNGLEGTLRLNAPLYAGGTLLEPYVFGGVGWDHYALSHTPVVTADIASSDDTLTVPFGLGFNAVYKGFIADARFAFRPTFFDNMVTAAAVQNNDLTNWTLGFQLGYEF
jgi:hypothetical protein